MRLQSFTAMLALFSLFCSGSTSPSPPRERPLQFRLAQLEPAEGLTPMRVEGRTGFIYVHPNVELDDRDIEYAAAMKGQFGQPSVQIKLAPSGSTKMKELTRKHQQKTIAIIADGKVVSTPIIMGEQIDDLLDIEGSFTQTEAEALAKSLNTKH